MSKGLWGSDFSKLHKDGGPKGMLKPEEKLALPGLAPSLIGRMRVQVSRPLPHLSGEEGQRWPGHPKEGQGSDTRAPSPAQPWLVTCIKQVQSS